MSIKRMTDVWENSAHEGGELLVLLALADHAGDDGICWPSVRTLAKKSRLKERQVQYCLKALAESGEIEILSVGKGRESSKYRVKAERCKICTGALECTSEVQPTAPKPSGNRQSKTGMKRFRAEEVILPLTLNTLTFKAAWSDWCKHRREKGQTLTESTAERQLNKLCGLGEGRAMLAIKFSIEQGYTGIYEPKTNATNQRPNSSGGGRFIAAPTDRAGQYAGVGRLDKNDSV